MVYKNCLYHFSGFGVNYWFKKHLSLIQYLIKHSLCFTTVRTIPCLFVCRRPERIVQKKGGAQIITNFNKPTFEFIYEYIVRRLVLFLFQSWLIWICWLQAHRDTSGRAYRDEFCPFSDKDWIMYYLQGVFHFLSDINI